MLPPDKEFLKQIDTFLQSAQYEDLEDFLTERLGEQPNNIMQQLQLDIVQKMQWQLPRIRKFQPRTMLLSMMHSVMQDRQKSKLLYSECQRRKIFEEKSHIVLFNQAMCQNREVAQFLYSKCLKLKPGFWPALLNYSVLLLRQQRRQQAFLLVDYYAKHYTSRKAIELQYIAVSSQENYYELMKRFRGKKWHWEIGFNLALYLKKIRKQMEALKVIREVLKVVKGNQHVGKVHILHGLICEQLRAWSEAKEAYAEALTFYEDTLQISIKIQKIEKKLQSSENNIIHFKNPEPRTHKMSRTLKQNHCLTNRPNHSYSPTAHIMTTDRANIKDRLRKVIDCKKSTNRHFQPMKLTLSPPESMNVSAIDKKDTHEVTRKFDETLGFSLQNWPNEQDNHFVVDAIEEPRHSQESKEELIFPQHFSEPPPTILLQQHQNDKKEQLQKQQKQTIREEQVKQKPIAQLPLKKQQKPQVQQLQGTPKEKLCQGISTKLKESPSEQPRQRREPKQQKQQPPKKLQKASIVKTRQVPHEQKAQKMHTEEQPKEIFVLWSNEQPQEQSKQSQEQPKRSQQQPIEQPKQQPEPDTATVSEQQPIQSHFKQSAPISPPPSNQTLKQSQKQTNKGNERQIQKQDNVQIRYSIDVPPVEPTSKALRAQTPNRKVKITDIQFMNQTLDFSEIEKPSKLSNKSSQKENAIHAGQSRSIRQIMVNPHFTKQRTQSIKTIKEIRENCHLQGITTEVDCLLSKEQHDKALEIYKRQYKNASSVHQKMNVLLKIAWVFQRSGCLENAKKTYQKCLKLGCNSRAFLKLGELLLKMGLTELGIDNLEKATCIMRDDEEIRLQLAYGYSMLQAGLPKALTITNQILLKDPTNLKAIMLSSNIHQKLGNIELALQISNAIDVNRRNQSVKHYIGLLKLQKQDIQGAYQCFRQALKINNRYVPSMVESASILSTDNPMAAVRIFEKALQIQPGNLSALTRLARLYETDLNDNQKAIATYTQALELSQSFQTYENLGNCYYRQKRYKEAIQNFKMAITLNSTGIGWVRVAQCYQHIKMHDKALNYYQLSLALQPSAETHKRMGLCHIHLQNFKSAIECFRKSIEMNETAEVYALTANCFYLVEDYDQAIDSYQKSIDLDDKNMSVQYNLAICFDQKQQFLASKTLYEGILQEQPNNVNCLYNLGNIMLVLGKNPEAVQLFQRAIQQQPENHQRRLELIELYETLNDLNRAESHLLYSYRDNDQDQQILDKLIRIYKKKKDIKKVNKYQKLLLNLKAAGMGSIQAGKAAFRSKTQT